MLKDTTNGKWKNSITMFEYGFTYYDTIDLAELFNQKEITAPVKNAASTIDGSDLVMQLAPDTKVYLTDTKELCQLIRDNPDQYFTSFIEYDQEPIIAPIRKGDFIGKITYRYNNTHSFDNYLQISETGSSIKEIVFTADLIAANNVNSIPMVTPEPTAVPEDFGQSGESVLENIQESVASETGRRVLLVILIILALISSMMLYSFADRHMRYQQYSKRQKAAKPRHKGRRGKDE